MTKKLNLEELLILAKHSEDPSKRLKAGRKAIDWCVERGSYSGLVKMAEDEGLSRELRLEAGRKVDEAGRRAIDFYVKEGYYWVLIKMAEDERLSRELRLEAGRKAIDLYAENR
ncbi:MAG: hypothetical protein KatS3mg001_601 [Candidatus Pacearchaeota archaeon]|nr:MAG: hypothetical protein KatS3mg001_601 [Candidatus Pacearchaeota archaeon]